jgi:hypothetical protein
MDGIEASRIIAETLKNISLQFGIDLEELRESHKPILLALHEEKDDKIKAAEKRGHDSGSASGRKSGRRSADLRHWSISRRGFGRIAQGEKEVIDKAGIFHIIDSAIRLGNKTPRAINKKVDSVQNELMNCSLTKEVLAILEDNRSLICDSFGIAKNVFDNCLEDINDLESPALKYNLDKQLSRLSTAINHISTIKELT